MLLSSAQLCSLARERPRRRRSRRRPTPDGRRKIEMSLLCYFYRRHSQPQPPGLAQRCSAREGAASGLGGHLRHRPPRGPGRHAKARGNPTPVVGVSRTEDRALPRLSAGRGRSPEPQTGHPCTFLSTLSGQAVLPERAYKSGRGAFLLAELAPPSRTRRRSLARSRVCLQRERRRLPGSHRWKQSV